MIVTNPAKEEVKSSGEVSIIDSEDGVQKEFAGDLSVSLKRMAWISRPISICHPAGIFITDFSVAAVGAS